VEVFNLLATHTNGTCYQSEIEFCSSVRALKDIVVVTEFWDLGQARQISKSVYKWNGTKYVGEFNVPQQFLPPWFDFELFIYYQWESEY